MLRETNRAQTKINVRHWKKHAAFTEHDNMNTAPFKTDWQVMNYKIYIEMEMTEKESTRHQCYSHRAERWENFWDKNALKLSQLKTDEKSMCSDWINQLLRDRTALQFNMTVKRMLLLISNFLYSWKWDTSKTKCIPSHLAFPWL